jgi:hypothetical protein
MARPKEYVYSVEKFFTRRETIQEKPSIFNKYQIFISELPIQQLNMTVTYKLQQLPDVSPQNARAKCSHHPLYHP